MYRLLATAIFLLAVCGPCSIVAEAEVDIRSVMGEMEAKMVAHAGDNMEQLKEFMTEKIVERLDDIDEILKSIQEKQSYFEHCMNTFPCGEHGKCSVVDDKHKCTCEDGYEGEHCEIFDVCRDVECLNGGTCHTVEMDYGNETADHMDSGDNHTTEHMTHMQSGEYMCVCNGTWYGDNCELQAPCAAALEQIDPDAPKLLGKSKPLCEIDGFYAPIQYRGASAYCVTTEGKTIPGYRMHRREVNEQTACSCARDEFSAKEDYDSHTSPGRPATFNCAKNGDYAPYVCERRRCYCQDTEGNVDKSSGVPRRLRRRKLNCPGM